MATSGKEISFPLPRSLDSNVYIRLNVMSSVIMIFITTKAASAPNESVPMGSTVFSLPDKFNPIVPLSTVLLQEENVDFTTRVAKLVVKKTGRHVYVCNSLSLADTGLGGTAEEEMEALKKVVSVISEQLGDVAKLPAPASNGVVPE